MADWPTLQEVRKFLRLQPDADQDAIIQTALSAAIDYGNRRTNYKFDPADEVSPPIVPDAVHQACLLHSARLYRRRDTVDGTIGWGDLGVVRIGSRDGDIEALYSAVG